MIWRMSSSLFFTEMMMPKTLMLCFLLGRYSFIVFLLSLLQTTTTFIVYFPSYVYKYISTHSFILPITISKELANETSSCTELKMIVTRSDATRQTTNELSILTIHSPTAFKLFLNFTEWSIVLFSFSAASSLSFLSKNNSLLSSDFNTLTSL